MSKFTEEMYATARTSDRGLVTGEPDVRVRQTWGEIHAVARAMAGGLARRGHRARRRGRGARRSAGRHRARRAGHLDARRVGDDAAPADPAHRPGRSGRRDTETVMRHDLGARR